MNRIMVNRHNREPSNLEVRLLDFSPLHIKALEFVNAQEVEKGQPLSTDCKPMNSHGFIETDDGVYVLCSEGVGSRHPISEEHPYELDFFTERVDEDNPGTRFMGIMPSCTIKLMTNDMLYGYDNGETTPLHDFIRTFGDRLETNYHNWVRHLRGEYDVNVGIGNDTGGLENNNEF